MTTVNLTIDEKNLSVKKDKTILEICKENGIEIPTLCYDEELKPNGSCGICIAEIIGHGIVSSCSTLVADGMVIQTKNSKIISIRKQRLEGLLAEHYGDCEAPCHLACPAGVDIQGYIALIKRGAYKEAVELIRESLPLPAIIGRICPHPCEEACRRNIVDEPISICSLKRFVADHEIMNGVKFIPQKKPNSGFKVAIIGSGPAGLSAAYYLSLMGHENVIFESLPKPGGMLRYGIPDYRLPQDILDKEIDTIKELGTTIETEQVFGKDFTLNTLLDNGFNAVFLAIGAHQSYNMKIVGEDLDGVIQGIDFLRNVILNKQSNIKDKRVVVIGGGNTAIDASRTALRLGAKEVTIVYRRSRAEMPASVWEIEEAEEEGIKLHFLASPVKVLGHNGKVSEIECIKMELGEPDSSGRRRPIPIKGSEFTIPVDIVIPAIGQFADLSCLKEDKDIEVIKRSIVVNQNTLMTNINGVFSGGDCISGAATAVEAIAAGKKAALSINSFLKNKKLINDDYLYNVSKGMLEDLNEMEFSHIEKLPRAKMPSRGPNERKNDFVEFEKGFSEKTAKKESKRCLECGCKAALDCKLRQLVTEYEVYAPCKDISHYSVDISHAFIERDPNKCIVCGLCVQTCREIQGVGAINLSYRVDKFEETCESCGHCMVTCPTGALVSKNALKPAYEIKTICTYCGCGCGIYLGVRGNTIVNARGDIDNHASHGRLCVKGRFGNEFVNHPDRLTTPLIKRDGKFVEATWREAIKLITKKFSSYKGGQFASISSAKCTNEENYLIQKFTRAVMGTNNIDHCARLCHAPSVAGLAQSFGSGAMTNSIDEIGNAACILAIGTNTTVAHPIIGLQVKKAVRNGTKLIVANPKRIDLCRFADIFLQHNPGTDVPLLMGIMKVILDEELHDPNFIKNRCENFVDFKESLKEFDLKTVEEITEVNQEKIKKAALCYTKNKPASILYSMGITQHTHGTDNVLATSNLALLTGNVGKESSGVNPLRGQSNVQGACDMAALPNVYPGYQKVTDLNIKNKFEKAWGCNLSPNPGLTHTEIFDAVYDGKIKAMYMVGENPILSEANASHVEDALKRMEFLVVQDIFLTETAEFADVVLPSASFAEKDGTFTNTERRVQRVRKVIEPIGNSKPDWWITCQIAKILGGKGFDFKHPKEIQDEIASLTPSYKGITYERLENGGLQWPCTTKDHPGTKFLHSERFATINGKGKFMPLKYKPPVELPDNEYPYLLTTDRSLYHFHTSTMSRKVEGLNILNSEELLKISPKDALALGIADGDLVEVSSRRGKVKVKANVTDICPPGVVSLTFHFHETPTNILTNCAIDPVAKIPETKVCAVRINKI